MADLKTSDGSDGSHDIYDAVMLIIDELIKTPLTQLPDLTTITITRTDKKITRVTFPDTIVYVSQNRTTSPTVYASHIFTQHSVSEVTLQVELILELIIRLMLQKSKQAQKDCRLPFTRRVQSINKWMNDCGVNTASMPVDLYTLYHEVVRAIDQNENETLSTVKERVVQQITIQAYNRKNRDIADATAKYLSMIELAGTAASASALPAPAPTRTGAAPRRHRRPEPHPRLRACGAR